MIRVLSALAALVMLAGFAPQDRYAAGQVWEYRTRPADAGSLLKIQRVETPEGYPEPIYHVSVVGLTFRNATVGTELPHTPVSRETLDASVTRLSDQTPDFPDPAPGIAQWKSDQGGVFTITVAEIIDIIDQQTADLPKPRRGTRAPDRP